MINKKTKKGFTLAEMMIVIVIISVILVGAAPIVTTKRPTQNKTPWRWASNNSDIYFGHGNTQTAIIGQSASVTDPNTRLYINTLENEVPIVYYTRSGSTKNIIGGILMTGQNLVLGNKISDVTNLNNIYIGSTTIANGDNNIAIGYNAMYKDATDGSADGLSNSVAIGINSIKNLQCNYCTALGYNTLFSEFRNGGEYDTGIGYHINLNNGNYTTAIGKNIYTDKSYNTLLGNIPNASGSYNVVIRQASDTQTEDQKSYQIGANTISYSVLLGSYDWGTSSSYGEGVWRSVLIGQPNSAGYYTTYDTIAIGNYANAKTKKEHMFSSLNNISVGGYSNALTKEDDSTNNTSLYTPSNSISIGTRAGSIKYNNNNNQATNSSFDKNINIGAKSGINELGSNNTARKYTENINIGYSAGLNNYGDVESLDDAYGKYNINIGAHAGEALAGYNNVAIGYNAGRIWRSSYNTSIGYNAGHDTYGEKLTFIGYNAAKPTNHHAWDDPSSASENDVYVGETNLFSVFDDITVGSSNIQDYHTYELGSSYKIPVFNIVYIPGTLVTLKYDTDFINDNYVYSSNELFTNKNIYLYTFEDGVVRGDRRFRVDSDALAHSPIFYNTSDIRLKNISGENKDGLAKIRKLKVYNYTFKNDKSNTPHIGVIAQDLQKIFPNAVTKDKDGYMMIRKEDMFYALINAVKELDLKVKFAISQLKDMFAKVAQLDLKLKNLEQSNEEINAQIADIDKRIEALEK